MSVPLRQLQVRRGLKADLPTLADGEIGFCEDSNELFVGTPLSGNLKVNTSYSPMAPGNWAGTPPSDIYSALDRLAAALAAFTGNPVP
jgi:Major tropism determinant N-terminal domain